MTRTTLALLAALLLPAPAQAAPALSVQDEAAITCNHWGLRTAALQAAKELGATVVRVNLIEWNNCEGAATATAAIAAAGMRPQLTLIGSTSWIRAQVVRERALVKTYAIWNEPDLGGWRCCKAPFAKRPDHQWVGNAASYRAAYRAGYRLVKRLDPGARVLFGEVSPHGMGKQLGGPRWLNGVLKAGRPLRADGVAIHPYDSYWAAGVDSQYLGELRAFKQQVRRYARRRMLLTPKGRTVPIYNTEYGQSRANGAAGDAAGAAKAYRYSTRLGFRQHNQYMIFPAFRENHAIDLWNTSVTTDGCHPAPAYFALRKAVTGRADRGTEVAWPACPDPIPGVTPPKPPGYGTPGYQLPGDPYS